MAEADAAKHKAAYSGRKSESTRNPHTSRQSRRQKDLAALCPEERVLEQWRISSGSPVSDESKVQFQVQARENTHRLADVRLWEERHSRSSNKVQDTGTIFLEFFFDGSPADYHDNQEVFTQAFEKMIEQQLQERRVMEFRQKFATRRRGSAQPRNDGGDCGEGGGAEVIADDDNEWKEYLRRPVPATNVSVRSLREAGCCLTFLVCQTSISWQASEVLGQITFQEHFPIDGKPQEIPKCDKPMPRWAYGMMACTAFLLLITLLSWWQVLRQVIFPEGASPLVAETPPSYPGPLSIPP